MVFGTLRPWGSSQAVKTHLSFECQRRQDALSFAFHLRHPDLGFFSKLVLPQAKPVADRVRQDELWRSTCFEMFMAAEGTTQYLEVNLAPSGDWNLYSLDDYRSGLRPTNDAVAPSFETNQDGAELTVSGMLRSAAGDGEFSSLLRAGAVVLSPCVVLAFTSGEREYWSVRHDGEKPDFHLRSSFVLNV